MRRSLVSVLCLAAGLDDTCQRENCLEMATADTGAYNDRLRAFVIQGYLCEQHPAP